MRVGDRVRDLGRYPSNCDGIVVCTDRFFWVLSGGGYYPQRAAFSLVVRFDHGVVGFYNSCGSTIVNGNHPILVRL